MVTRARSALAELLPPPRLPRLERFDRQPPPSTRLLVGEEGPPFKGLIPVVTNVVIFLTTCQVRSADVDTRSACNCYTHPL